MSQGSPRQILFLCTGNYNRSRFAELLFNALAREHALPWRATSRGIDLAGVRQYIVGAISREARAALADHGIEVGSDLREPMQLRLHDLDAADLIVAVCEAEHRPHIERDFPSAAGRVRYWAIRDVPITPADEALVAVAEHVRDLIECLKQVCPRS
jgi:protein-tyrosine phosphatase